MSLMYVHILCIDYNYLPTGSHLFDSWKQLTEADSIIFIERPDGRRADRGRYCETFFVENWSKILMQYYISVLFEF